MSSIQSITQARIVAIVRLENYASAVEVAQALVDGGITVVEFTPVSYTHLDVYKRQV